MKSKYSLIVILFVIASFSFGNVATEPIYLKVEKNHSTILFSVPIANGLTRITGKFNDYDVDIDYVENDFTKSQIRATIRVSSIDTGIDGRDEHLRTADFFDVENYPEITFVSDRIEKKASGYIAFGEFTMRGVTKKIELPFKVTGEEGNYTIGISSRLSINRMNHGVGSGFKHDSMENFLGEEIAIEIDFWTKKRKIKD